ncbi:hypothetical protein Bbelb_353010, partial [Branchiostoma belcheri]
MLKFALSSHTLTEPEKPLLSKGLNFAVTPNKIPNINIVTETESAIHRARLPQRQAEALRTKVATTLKVSKPPASNISREERTALKDLATNQDILILPADKGRCTVVLDREQYGREVQDLLGDKDTYTPLKRDPTNKFKGKISTTLKKLQTEGVLDRATYLKLNPTTEQPPAFYGLPKIHKQTVPLRPIVPKIGSVTYELAGFLAKILGPLVGKSQHLVQNSAYLINKIKDIQVEDDETTTSYDVCSLFTSIPPKEAVSAAREALEADDTLADRTNLFMFENKALSTFNDTPPANWFRYVDADFFDHINQINDHIKFTQEPSHDNMLPFLHTKTIVEEDDQAKTDEHRHLRGALAKCGYQNWTFNKALKPSDKSKKTLKQRLVHPKDRPHKDTKANVIYRLKCEEPNCNNTYIGETSRPLKGRGATGGSFRHLGFGTPSPEDRQHLSSCQGRNRGDLGVVCEGLNHRENVYWKTIDIRTTDAAMKSTLQNVDVFYAGGDNSDAERAAIISSSVAPLLRNVNIRYSGDAAIRIKNSKTPFQIKNCDISENHGVGLIVKNPSADVTIVSSIFSKNFPVGMQVTGGHNNSNLLITDSTFAQNSGAGLMLSDVPMNVDTRQSNFSTNSHYGLSVFTTTQVSLVTDGCHFDHNGLNGFHARYLGVSGNRSHTIMRNGVSEGNTGDGFNLEIEYQEYHNITSPPISDQITIDQSNFTSNKNGSVKITVDNSYEDRFPVVQLTGGVHRDNMATVIEVGGTRAEVTIQDVEFDSSQCGSKSVIHVHGYDKTVNITGNRFVRNVCRRVVLFNTTDVSADANPLVVVGSIFENNEYEPESLAHISDPLNEYCTMEIVGSGEEHTITQNSFLNSPAGLELCSSDDYHRLAVTQIRAEKNWWGTTDIDSIKEKIFDNNDWTSGGPVKFSPYLSSPSGNPIFTEDTENMTASSIGGRLNGTLRLTITDSPVTLTRDLTILPDSVLIVEAGVEFRVHERVGILNLGKLQLEGQPSSPITFDVVRKTVSNRTIPVRLTGGTNSGEGRLEVQYSGQWLPVCHDWYGEFATIACQQLGLGSYKSETYSYDSSIRNWLTIRCDGSEDIIGECSLYHTSRCGGNSYRYLRLTCDSTEGQPQWIVNGVRKRVRLRCERTVKAPEGYHIRVTVTQAYFNHPPSRNRLAIYESLALNETNEITSLHSGKEVYQFRNPLVFTSAGSTITLLLQASSSHHALFLAKFDVVSKGDDVPGLETPATLDVIDITTRNFRYGDGAHGAGININHYGQHAKYIMVNVTCQDSQGKDNLQENIIFNVVGNVFRDNIYNTSQTDGPFQYSQHPDLTSCTVEIGGYNSYYYLRHNMLDNPDMNYAMCSRVSTTSPDELIDARYNWWGTAAETEIQEKIHDFDDWNDRAAVEYFPYLTGPDLSSPPADSSSRDVTMTTDNIGGRLYDSLHLQKDAGPYTIKADLTVLKNASLTIDPGSTIKIHPCLGLLNLGSLVAHGTRTEPINFELADIPVHQPQVRLMGGRFPWEGRVEVFYNGEWGTVCGRSYWSSQDANVVCRELGYGRSFISNTNSFGQGSGPVWIGRYNSRPDCTGNEMSIFNCLRGPPGNVYWGCTHYYDVGIRCNINTHVSPRPTCRMKKWGGITSKYGTTAVLTNLKFSNTGNLHGRSHAALEDDQGTANISHIGISECVGTGIKLLGGKTTQSVKNVNISGCNGYAGVSLTCRKSRVMSSTSVRITDSIFTAGSFELTPHTRSITNCLANPESIIRLCAEEPDLHLKNDMCFVHVETGRTSSTCYKHLYAGVGITIELTVSFVQFQYYSSGLQVFADRSQTQQIGEVTQSDNGKTYIRFVSQTMMSLQYRSYYTVGQIFGEIMIYNETSVAGPSMYIIENSIVDNTKGTVINVTPADDAIFDIQRNMFQHNQPHTDDNEQAVISSVLINSYISVRNNYIANNFMASLSLDLANQKGGNITVLDNLFFRNTARTTIMVTGAVSNSTQQSILIDNNVFSSNDVGSNENVVKFENVDGQLSNNVFFNNSGQHVVTWEGRSRTDSLQRCENNLFYDNIALTPGEKYTLVVSGRDVQLHGNVLTNPANDAELATSDRTRYYPVNATLNWWGFNSTSDISSRIRDKNDRGVWAEVHFQPWIQEEPTDGPCGLGWIYSQTFSACYRYMGGAQSWGGAVQSCKAQYSVLSKRFAGPEKDFFDSLLIARKVDFVPDVPVWMDNEMQGQENATVNCKVYLRDSQEAVQGVSCNSFFPYICKRPVVDDCPNYCSHHGRCEGETCICGRGWEGEDCSKFTCNDRNSCGEFGTCVGPNICRCRNGWQGRACTVSYCNRFTNCRTCTREVGCGWCEERQSCDSGLYRGPDVSPCTTSWFYHSCFTVLDCEQWQCNPSLPTTTVESCLRCQDVENCFKKLEEGYCKVWNEDQCPKGFIHPLYNDTTRIEKILIGHNVEYVPLDGNILYRCPVRFSSWGATMFVNEGDLDIRIGQVLSSPQANGVLHKVEQVTKTVSYTVIVAHPATLEDMLDYSDFSQEVQLEMAVDMKKNEGAPELSEVERVLSGNGTFDGNTVRVITEDTPVYKCIGSRAMNEGEGSYHLLVRDLPDHLSVGDVIVSNHSNRILEQVIQQTSTPLGVFVQTELQDCFTTFNFREELMTTDGVTLPASLPCSGGPEGAHGLLIVDSAGREVDLETGDVVVGRRSGRLLAKVLNITPVDEYTLVQVDPILSRSTMTTPSRRRRREDVTASPAKHSLDIVIKDQFSDSTDSYNIELSTSGRLSADIKLSLAVSTTEFKTPTLKKVGAFFIGGKLQVGMEGSLDVLKRTWTHGSFRTELAPIYVSLCVGTQLCIPAKIWAHIDTEYKISAEGPGSIQMSSTVTKPDIDGGGSWKPQEGSQMFEFDQNKESGSAKIGISSYSGAAIESDHLIMLELKVKPRFFIEFPTSGENEVNDWTSPLDLNAEEDTFGYTITTSIQSQALLRVSAQSCSTECPYSDRPQYVGVTSSMDYLKGALKVTVGNDEYYQEQLWRREEWMESDRDCQEQPSSIDTCRNICLCPGGATGRRHPTDESFCMCPCHCGSANISFTHPDISGDGCNCELCPGGDFKTVNSQGHLHCPCLCPDNSISELTSSGGCEDAQGNTDFKFISSSQCSCTCPDGSRDVVQSDGSCPCKCTCNNCHESVLGPQGCICSDSCPDCENDEEPEWQDCVCKCPQKTECGIPPTCVVGRMGPDCRQPDCRPCQGCSGNGRCITSTHSCQSSCVCSRQWFGDCCELRRPRPIGGDPHLQTLDGKPYDYHGIGEFWDCKSVPNDFGVQTRMYAYKGASLIGGVAVKAGHSIVTLMTSSNATENDVPNIRIDGDLFQLSVGEKYPLNNGTIHLLAQRPSTNATESGAVIIVSITFASGATVSFDIRYSPKMGRQFVNILFNPTATFKGSTEGLCGLMDDDDDNDFTGPDGTVYNDTSVFAETRRINKTHYGSGLMGSWSWNSSNFHPDDVMDPAYSDPNHRPSVGIDGLTQEQKEKAEEMCIALGLTGTLLNECVFDVSITNDTTFTEQEVFKGCPNQCSGRGRCVNGTCDCITGWSGEDCNVGNCTDCSEDHGKCELGFCRCEPGWEGAECDQQATCYAVNNCTSMSHGTCITTDVCRCEPGYIVSRERETRPETCIGLLGPTPCYGSSTQYSSATPGDDDVGIRNGCDKQLAPLVHSLAWMTPGHTSYHKDTYKVIGPINPTKKIKGRLQRKLRENKKTGHLDPKVYDKVYPTSDALFTSVPGKDVVGMAVSRVENDSNWKDHTLLTPKEFGELLHLVVYVDDTGDVNRQEHEKEHINTRHDSIKFTIERKQDNRLPMLDFMMIRNPDNTITTDVFRKETHTKHYLQWSSNHPVQQKLGIVRTLMHLERLNRAYDKHNVNLYSKPGFTLRNALVRANDPPAPIVRNQESRNPHRKIKEAVHIQLEGAKLNRTEGWELPKTYLPLLRRETTGGADCSKVPTCRNVAYCTDHGVCVDYDTCLCDEQWTGDMCDQFSCAALDYCSGHGSCVDIDVCHCEQGWTGSSCVTPDCPEVNQCFRQGDCVGPNTCQCYSGYQGLDCSEAQSCPELQECNENGVCVNSSEWQRECNCFPGFSGAGCDHPDCTEQNNCTNHGSCIEPNLCQCDSGYTGNDCANFSCEALQYCSSHGRCVKFDTCSCDPGWSGGSCNIAICSNKSDCSGQGTCVAPNTCACFPGFQGGDCSEENLPNEHPPIFQKDRYDATISENEPVGSPILTVSANDTDSGRNGEVSYRLAQTGLDSENFAVHPTSGIITSVVEFDFESLEHASFSLIVEAFDQGVPTLTGTATVNINITDQNDNKPVISTPPETEYNLQSISPIGFHVTTVQASDADRSDDNSRITYGITSVSPFVSIDATNGSVTVSSALESGTYVLRVRASDHGLPPKTDEVTLRMIVTKVSTNTAPKCPEDESIEVASGNLTTGTTVATIEAEDADNSPNGDVSYSFKSLTGELASLFGIDPSTGRIYVATVVPQINNTFSAVSITVEARDNAVDSMSCETKVVVIITNDNRISTEKASTTKVDENTIILVRSTAEFTTGPGITTRESDSSTAHPTTEMATTTKEYEKGTTPTATTEVPMSVEARLFKGVIKIENREWKDELEDQTSDEFKTFAAEVKEELDNVYRNSDLGDTYHSVEVTGFSRGSVRVDFMVRFNSPTATPIASDDVLAVLEGKANIGGLQIDHTVTSISESSQDGNSQSQSMAFPKCTAPTPTAHTDSTCEALARLCETDVPEP